MKVPVPVKEVLGSIERLVRAIFTFFGGYMAGKTVEEKKTDKAVKKAEDEQNENDQDFERRRRDKSRRKRLLDLIRRSRGND